MRGQVFFSLFSFFFFLSLFYTRWWLFNLWSFALVLSETAGIRCVRRREGRGNKEAPQSSICRIARRWRRIMSASLLGLNCPDCVWYFDKCLVFFDTEDYQAMKMSYHFMMLMSMIWVMMTMTSLLPVVLSGSELWRVIETVISGVFGTFVWVIEGLW